MGRTATSIDGVLVLAGGQGRRIGAPKAWLEWEGEPLLIRVRRRLAALHPDIVVAARRGQPLPTADYERVDDSGGAGPLAGLAAGLEVFAARGRDLRIAVTACDYPYTSPALFLTLANLDTTATLVMPEHGGQTHPLQAVWRAEAHDACRTALDAGVRRVHQLAATLPTRIVRDFDATIDLDRALRNVNDPQDLPPAADGS